MRRLEEAIAKAGESLQRTQNRYKRDFDKRVRHVNRRLQTGDYVYLDPTDGSQKLRKLEMPAVGPFRVVANDGRTVVINRSGEVEHVSADRVVYAPPPPDEQTASSQDTNEFETIKRDLADKNTE